MITKEAFSQLCSQGPILLDGATGSNLMKAGMPRGCCTEEWILANPEKLVALQRRYVEAGSQILLAPTFQAQPIALERVNLQNQTEAVNAHLAALTRSVSPDVLVAGDLTTLATFTDSWDVKNFDLLVENYRRQIKGLIDGGVDLLMAETLMYPTEAEAIFTAAELESVPCCIFTFTMQQDGSLFSGMDAIPVLSFGISMVIIASRFHSPLFMIGAALSVLAGCCKVAWKLVLGIAKKDLKWLNKPFVPMQATGFLLMLVSFVIGFGSIDWSAVLAAVTGFPSLAFFLGWIALMGVMIWYRKHKFQRDDARSNWTAQIINAVGQTCLLLGILFAG